MKKYLNKNKYSVFIIAFSLILFAAFRMWISSFAENENLEAEEYAEYETGKVLQILYDNTEADETSDGAFRGEQLMLVEITSGQYKGETMQVSNYVGPLYGVPLDEGDGATLIISTFSDGSHNATVYEYNREVAIIAVLLLFILAAVLVGGKTGAKSLLGLFFTIGCVFLVLIPLLLKGFPTLLSVFITCTFVAIVSFTILGGVEKKTICASVSTIMGIAISLIFALIAQHLTKINGLRVADVEPLLQLRQTGTPIGLKNLLVGGIIISALGAVMDVSMSISSALNEIHDVDKALTSKQLFKSGMNIGRDMVGTMTNTLILAFLGSSFVLVIYLYSIGLQTHQLFSSSYLAIEVISGISSSIGVILTVPITAMISSVIMSNKKTGS